MERWEHGILENSYQMDKGRNLCEPQHISEKLVAMWDSMPGRLFLMVRPPGVGWDKGFFGAFHILGGLQKW